MTKSTLNRKITFGPEVATRNTHLFLMGNIFPERRQKMLSRHISIITSSIIPDVKLQWARNNFLFLTVNQVLFSAFTARYIYGKTPSRKKLWKPKTWPDVSTRMCSTQNLTKTCITHSWCWLLAVGRACARSVDAKKSQATWLNKYRLTQVMVWGFS